jgi:hypothetical protein
MGYWKASKHYCFKYKAIGIDEWAFAQMIFMHADSIKVTDKDSGITYLISVQDFYAKSIKDDLGWGMQLFCRIDYWNVKPSKRVKKTLAIPIYKSGQVIYQWLEEC